MTDDELISQGTCVSPRGVDHCVKCIDRCEASHWKRVLSETLKDSGVTRSDDHDSSLRTGNANGH